MLVARTIGLPSGRPPPVAHVDVVAVERDVERAEGELEPAALGDERAEAGGERDAARLDADERDAAEILVPLDELVRDPRERTCDRVLVEQFFGRPSAFGGGTGDVRRHRAPFRPRWTGLKVVGEYSPGSRRARPNSP